MTTTEFIKLIKSFQKDREKLFTSRLWSSTTPIIILAESELEKIEKVNIELLEALIQLNEGFKSEWGIEDNSNRVQKNLDYWNKLVSKAIKNASNIKQI